jgi:oligogalacturonide lyase
MPASPRRDRKGSRVQLSRDYKGAATKTCYNLPLHDSRGRGSGPGNSRLALERECAFPGVITSGMKPSRDAAALSRRRFLLSIPAAAILKRTGSAAEIGSKGRHFPAATFRYADPSTEFPVTRLTDPAFTSILPACYNRPISKHNFMLYASNITGRFEAFRMDLKNGQSRQLTEAENLDPASLTLLADGHGFCYADGARLMESNLSSMHEREVYRLPAGLECGGLSVAEDGLYAAVVERPVEKKAGKYRLQLVNMMKGGAVKLAENDDEIRDPIPRPRRASVLYRRVPEPRSKGALDLPAPPVAAPAPRVGAIESRPSGSAPEARPSGSASGTALASTTSVWLANYDAAQDYRLRLADGETGPAEWSPDGRTVLYLNYPAEHGKLHNLREFTPDTNEDKMLAPTTQFVGFGPNADATVFVGASGSKASPHVLLLVRAVQRELTLAEHRASDPRMVAPVFSPNSQRVYFSSDQHGKPAIYTMSVERLVEETEG